MENSGFFDQVYTVTRQIPFGKVTTYGAIAKYLGSPQSARMVGWALNASKNDDTVPAHRVVNKNGLLSGKQHFKGTNLMQQLLENENISIRDHQITNFKDHFWEPFQLLKED